MAKVAGIREKDMPARVRSLAPGQEWEKDCLPLALAAMGNLRVPVITFAACAITGLANRETQANQPALFSTLVGGGEGWRTICHVMMCEE